MEQLAKEFSGYRDHLYDYWLNESLWTPKWWLAVFLSIIPWAVWVFVRKKDSTWRLLGAGFFVMLVTIFFDTAGVVAGFWNHPVKVAPLPLLSCAFPWDYSIFPVATMLFLQYFPRGNPFVKAAVYAVSGTFVFHPLAVWLGFVKEEAWVIFAFLPFLYVLYLLSHAIAYGRHFEGVSAK